MPIYEYYCTACGARKDVLQKLSDPILTVCPECSGETFKRALSAPAFQLKGTGWYVTDFRDGQSKKPPKAADRGEAGESSSQSSASGKDGGSSGAGTSKAGESSVTGSA